MDEQHKLVKLLNSSGFAFQLGVEANVRNGHECRALARIIREHPWFHENRNESGFVDLIIEKEVGRFVVECKRTTEAKWLFLDPGPRDAETPRAKLHWQCRLDGKNIVKDWSDIGVHPPSPEVQFCNVRGGGENRQSMLDRIGFELIAATEAVASKEMSLLPGGDLFHYYYVPVIVTNAELLVGKFNPETLDLDSGKIDSAEFSKANSVRYRKSLAVSSVEGNGPSTLSEANEGAERTVFIVRANAFSAWLDEWTTAPKSQVQGMPWEKARKDYWRE